MSQMTVFQAINEMRDLSTMEISFYILVRDQVENRFKKASFFNNDLSKEFIDLDTLP
ncbi:hypothetical protein [Algoriphagus persicinus]|uniref:hypothetical protein n=1 Tax=Algoriphagus persicinus TaxID=3108754 RepID=UPI002B3C497F|nr:hypothetical protein [Algoriphagus sp. E1-3-M2]MEB2783156.1 hypothetical protein [Algoriphagus sp. E1-3-M2]